MDAKDELPKKKTDVELTEQPARSKSAAGRERVP